MARKNIITTRTVTTLWLTIVIGFLAWSFIVKPELDRLSSTIEDRDSLKKELAEIDKKKELLGQVRENYAQIQQDIQKLEVAIPKDSNTGEYVAALEALANDTGVNITNLHTSFQAQRVPIKTNENKPERQKATVKKTLEEELLTQFNNTGIEIKTDSSYESLYAFISRVLNMDRFSILSSVNMTTASDGSTISSTLSFNIYHREAAKESSNNSQSES